MKSKSIGMLTVGALALAGLAYFMVAKRGETPAAASAKLFPGLEAKINDPARVEIVKGGANTVLAKGADGAWIVESRGGYPAEFENVKTLLISLGKAEIVEEKTSNPDNYSRIGVEDPKTPDPTKPVDAAAAPEATGSTLVTVKDSGGATLASVILGNTPTGGGGGESPRFVRRAGEKVSFLAKNAPSAEVSVMSWIGREILKIDGTRVQSAVVTSAKPVEEAPAPSGDQPPSTLTTPPALPQMVIVERGAPTPTDAQGKFEFKNLPPGREVKSPGQESQIATALSYLDKEDVLPASQLGDVPIASTAEYKTKDGLSVTLTIREKDGKTWGTLKADAFAVIPPVKAEEPKPADGEKKDGEKKEGEAPKAEPPAGPPVPAIDPKIADEAKALNAKHAPWAYAIPSWKASQFKSNWKELLKEVAPPAAPTGPVGPTAPTETPKVEGGPG